MSSLVQHLGEVGLDSEGIFREAASAAQVTTIYEKIENGSMKSIPSDTPAREAAGVLRRFLAEMPEPLFPFSCYDELLSLAAKTPDERRPRVGPHPALLQPGPPQQGAPWVVAAIRCLFRLLHEVSARSDRNRMTADNLAIVFAPTVLRKEQETLEQVMKEHKQVEAVLADLIAHPDGLP